MKTNYLRLKLIFLVTASLLTSGFAENARALTITPSILASIHDESLDGFGDSFNTSPFEGLLRQQAFREDRAILEFDLSSIYNTNILEATLTFDLIVNNAGGSQFREFDIFLYTGNGVADLFDFSSTDHIISTVGFFVSSGHSTYNLDIAIPLQNIIDASASFAGFVFDPLGDDNFPTIVTNSAVTASAVPEPSSILLLTIGLLALLGSISFLVQ